MSQEATQSSSSAAVSSPSPASAPAAAPSAPAAAPSTPSSSPAALTSAAPASDPGVVSPFTPNYKFKVMDKELEIDDFIRPTIKDAETEKKVRELYERAHGIDFVKQQRDRIREESKSFRGQIDPVIQGLQKATKAMQSNDMDTVFKTFGIPEEKILQWAVNKAKYMQLPPEQRSQVDAQMAAKERADQLAEENEGLRSNSTEMLVQSLQTTLDLALERPEVKSAAEMFDARAGQPGAFVKEIIARGDYLYRTTGKMVSPAQVASDLIKFAGLSGGVQSTQSTNPVAAAPQAAPTPVVAAPPAKPSITHVSSKGTSPVKKGFRSIDDLRKEHKRLAAN